MPHKPVGEETVGVWTVPRLGVNREKPIYELGTDEWYDSLNVLLHDAAVRPRPGTVLFNAASLLDRPMGAFSTISLAAGFVQEDAFQNDAFQIGSSVPTSTLLVGTTRRIWTFFGGLWRDITGTLLTAGDIHHVRFAAMEISNVIQTIITNGFDPPQVWDGASAAVSAVAGSPPKWSDIAVASDRFVGIVPPYTVRWGNALSIATWPAANARQLADTTDLVRAIRQLGTQGFAVYKDKSIWTGFATGGSDAAAFRFDLRRIVEGPAGPACVVDVDGVHVYLTPTGRVGTFDGAQHQWIADGIWPLIRADIDTGTANRAFGVYDPLTGYVQFFYPRLGESPTIKGLITLIPPREEKGTTKWLAFPGRLVVPVSAGTDRRFDARDVMLLRSDDFKSYLQDDNVDDAGTAFTGFWQTGLKLMSGLDPFRVESIESFAERGVGYGSLTIKPVTSYALDLPGGTVGAGKVIDLTSATVKEHKGFDAKGRFMGLRYEFTTPITLRWMMGKMAARRVE